ncbi:MAG: nucleotidyltransferase family protein [Sphingopyxis sp.]|jgi:hypothetical protein|uniref:nucleotidyltransferase family protein n=1 Tax=unclassified Sphingopyxis TaxID=2614943 RepID=UPI000736EE1E|nr:MULTISPECIES: nucleotidyltransferase family protein [unclassified Sphingopyxis]KTE21922.1 hypothetical protein ATE67_04580 [Sphingopyxis sp. H050]MBR2174224.1 nucleotidyltransferase family protein [Sphingopyxis sp.]
MGFGDHLSSILENDHRRMAALKAVEELSLPDGWIGAGFVRDAVWDYLHGRAADLPAGDVDVVWFDRHRVEERHDREIEIRLRQQQPDFDWSVKNQARMHLRNGDRPYASVMEAMRFWPETATAVAVRLVSDGWLEINAPFGLDDLFAPRLVPTSSFTGAKRHIFDGRVASKKWLLRFPLLQYG